MTAQRLSGPGSFDSAQIIAAAPASTAHHGVFAYSTMSASKATAQASPFSKPVQSAYPSASMAAEYPV